MPASSSQALLAARPTPSVTATPPTYLHAERYEVVDCWLVDRKQEGSRPRLLGGVVAAGKECCFRCDLEQHCEPTNVPRWVSRGQAVPSIQLTWGCG